MPPRAAISNFIMTVVILFFMLLLGMLLKARYRLPSEKPVLDEVPRAIPVATPVEETVYETRAYREGDWWVLPNPELVESRASEPDTLRIRSGPKEDVFVLYFVDALESGWTRPRRIREQSEFFGQAPDEQIIGSGTKALRWVTGLLGRRPFVVYTKWGRVPETERYYAFIRVETEAGKHEDLGELLVRRGYAAPAGQQTRPMPESLPPVEQYMTKLQGALVRAKKERTGVWGSARQ